MNTSSRCVALCVVALLAGCDLLGGSQSRIKRATEDLAKGDYNAAVVNLRAVTDKEPSNRPAQLLLLKAHLQRMDVDAAQTALNEAVKAGATAAEVAPYRAKMMAGRGNLKELLASIEDGSSGLEEPLRSLYRGNALLGLGKTIEALAIYDALLVAHPDLTEASVRTAEAHVQLGRPEQALEQLAKAVKDAPQSAEAWAVQSGVLQSVGRLDEARDARDHALALAPGQLTYGQRVTLISNAFMSALQAGDTSAASSAYTVLLGISPLGPLTRLYAAELDLATGDAAKAVSDLTKLSSEVPDFPQVRSALISGLLEKRNVELAMRELDGLSTLTNKNPRVEAVRAPLKTAAEAEPDSPKQAIALASAHVLLGEPHIARRLIDAAVAANPQVTDLAASSIVLDLESNHKARGLEKAQALAAAKPKEQLAVSMLAQALKVNDKPAEAAEAYEQLWLLDPTAQGAVEHSRARRDANLPDSTEPLRRWLQRKPGDGLVRLLLADAEATLGNTDKAIAEYEQVLKDRPNQILALNNLAMIYADRGDPRALPLAKRAWETSPKAPMLIDTYAVLLARNGNPTQAKALLEEAIALAPAVPEMRYHYAQVLAVTGDRQGARRWLEEALRGGGTFAGRDAALKLRDSLLQ